MSEPDRPWRLWRTGLGGRMSQQNWCFADLQEAMLRADILAPHPLAVAIENVTTGERHRRDDHKWSLVRQPGEAPAPSDPRAPISAPEHAVDQTNYWWRRD